MKKLITILLTVTLCILGFAQSFSWAKQFRSYTDYDDYITKIQKDSSGNVYLLGRTVGYSGIDVDPSPSINLLIPTNISSSSTNGTTFVIKLDNNGNYIWSHKISERHLDFDHDLKVKNGKVYALTEKSILQGNNIIKFCTITILDLNGNLISETPISNSTPNSFDIDDFGNIFLSTYTFFNLTFAQPINTPFNDTNSTGTSYLIKLNNLLEVQWIKKNINGISNKIALNSMNDIYFVMNSMSGPSQYLIQRYTSNGNLVWSGTQENQHFSNIVVDKNDKLIISGDWMAQFAPIDVDPSPSQHLLPSNTYKSLYLLWFDTSNNLSNVKKYLNNGQNFPLTIEGINIDDFNNLHVNGRFESSFNANTDNGIDMISLGSGYFEGCSISFDSLANYKKSFRIGSTNPYNPNSHTRIYQTLNINNNYYYVGIFNWHCDFDPSSNEFFLNTVNNIQLNNDGFLLKLEDCQGQTSSQNQSICVNSSIQLTASGGTSYSWTGPNGFTSNLQNPAIPNATSINSGVYTCQIAGSTTCNGSFSVNVFVGDNVLPIPTITTLPTITGDCNTVITNFPTATDNCAGLIAATTNNPLSYSLPGTYTIVWSYNDGNGNVTTQNQQIIVTSPVAPSVPTANQSFCSTANPTIASLQITGQNIKWYDSANNLLNTSTALINGQTYYATQTINGCESNKVSVVVTLTTTPVPNANTNQEFCISANPTLSNLVVTGTALQFYNATGGQLPITTPLTNGQTYFVTQTINGCESSKLPIAVSLTTGNIPAKSFETSICNSSSKDVTMVVNLHQYESDIISNSGSYIFEFFTPTGSPIFNASNYSLNIGFNLIKVKVSNAQGCSNIVDLKITLKQKPEIELQDKISICEGQSATLAATPGLQSYLWSTGATTSNIVVSTAGTYWVEITAANGCSNKAYSTVSFYELGKITSISISGNTATIQVSPTGNYQYSLDNINWQNYNVFSNLANINYTVYVRNLNNCNVDSKAFSLFNIPNTLTPNADGFNDSWKISGIEHYPGTKIQIFDRNSTPIFEKTFNGEPFIWNGKYNNSYVVPTGNYWYVLTIPDGRVFTGWLLIKNR